jgi:hypothetical protein
MRYRMLLLTPGAACISTWIIPTYPWRFAITVCTWETFDDRKFAADKWHYSNSDILPVYIGTVKWEVYVFRFLSLAVLVCFLFWTRAEKKRPTQLSRSSMPTEHEVSQQAHYHSSTYLISTTIWGKLLTTLPVSTWLANVYYTQQHLIDRNWGHLAKQVDSGVH